MDKGALERNRQRLERERKLQESHDALLAALKAANDRLIWWSDFLTMPDDQIEEDVAIIRQNVVAIAKATKT